jgi:tryptophan 2,3-dioxygenase
MTEWLVPSAGPALPGRGEEMLHIQRAGRAALSAAQRERLADWYEEACRPGDGAPTASREERLVAALLTRPFSRRPDIPEYYRYTSLHVYDWFLTLYRREPVEAGITAIRATLLDLAEREQTPLPPQPGYGPAEATERRARLAALIETLDGVLSAPWGQSDERLDRRLQVLVRCTGLPQSTIHHEHLFLRSVHACEIAFFLTRWSACRAVAAISAGERESAVRHTRLTAGCAELLSGVLHLLRTLSPEQFMSFRAATGAASAVQSLNYHLAELAVYGYDPRKADIFLRLRHLHRLNEPGYRDIWPLRAAVRTARDPDLSAALSTVERSLRAWRGQHYGFGRIYLPQEVKGSGGTEGAGYLKRIVDKDICATGPPGPVPEAMFRFALS